MIPRIATLTPHGLYISLEQLSLSSRAFSTTRIAPSMQKKKPQRSRYKDEYANKHAEARRAANKARQDVLRKERAAALGDPIRGIPTEFVESFDTALPPRPESIPADSTSTDTASTASISSTPLRGIDPLPPLPEPPTAEPILLNHFLTLPELESAVKASQILTTPPEPSNPATSDPTLHSQAVAAHSAALNTASIALSRILDLSNASSAHRTRANTRRCIATFGRHVTDTFLKPKPLNAIQLAAQETDTFVEKTPRAGADTGSSEVQIAILTAKIRVLADRYEGVNRNDKVNKRNLRLLLHRRQKLLKYMYRKERGGERWRYMLQTLGLTEANWKGEIEVR
jgi:ribosomal protein S15